jgi:anti-repressor protein
MNTTEIFNFENQQVRTQVINNQIWFIGKDVANILGYSRTDNAIRKFVEEEDKLTHQISASGQRRSMTVINESGLYSLILSSKMENAKLFKRWVTSEVLPSIRKNGGYVQNQENQTPKQIMANALVVAQNIIKSKDKAIEDKEEQIQLMKPKEIFADSVATSNQTILVEELAKILKQNGHEIGKIRLFVWLRNNGYLIKRKGSSYNSPTQYSMELDLMKIKETTITHSNGYITINRTPKITGKGQIYFVNKFNQIKDKEHE